MRQHKAFEMINKLIKGRAYVSVSKETIRGYGDEITSEWVIYVSRGTKTFRGTGESFKEAYKEFLSEMEQGESE